MQLASYPPHNKPRLHVLLIRIGPVIYFEAFVEVHTVFTGSNQIAKVLLSPARY